MHIDFLKSWLPRLLLVIWVNGFWTSPFFFFFFFLKSFKGPKRVQDAYSIDHDSDVTSLNGDHILGKISLVV